MAKGMYVTRTADDGGLDFRLIADVMGALGDPMGHSTARNCVNRTMERFATALMVMSGVVGDPVEVARSPGFQHAIEELVHEVYADIAPGGIHTYEDG